MGGVGKWARFLCVRLEPSFWHIPVHSYSHMLIFIPLRILEWIPRCELECRVEARFSHEIARVG